MKTLLTPNRLTAGIAASLLLVTLAMGQSSGSPQSKPAAKQAVRLLLLPCIQSCVNCL